MNNILQGDEDDEDDKDDADNNNKEGEIVPSDVLPQALIKEIFREGVTLRALATYLRQYLQDRDKVRLIAQIVEDADGVRSILDWLEITGTSSAFNDQDDPGKKKLLILEGVAQEYPFKQWLDDLALPAHQATKAHVMAWWDFFKNRCSDRGYMPGSINRVGSNTDLWKATSSLARLMEEDPKKYGYLPAHLVNQPEIVTKALQADIVDPVAWIEVLVGETMPDMESSEVFLTTFNTSSRILPLREQATSSIEKILAMEKLRCPTK